MKIMLSTSCKAVWLLSILAAAALSPLAGAQSYPTKPIRLIVPFPPGGAVDAIGRIIGQQLGKSFGHNVVIDNRGGAAGAIGSEIAARAPADGYTLLVGSTSTISINPALNSKLAYSPQRDFVPVSLVGYVPHVLLVNASVPATNVTSFVAFAKAQQKPVTYASVGTGSPHHLAGEIFKGMTGINMVHVPYTGSGPALVGLMGGEVQFLSLDMPAALPQLGTGRVKALGIAASKRDPLAPDLPTVAESGLPGFEISGWYGIFAPIKTPKDIVAKLSAEIARLLATPETRGSLAKIGVNVLGGSPQEFAAYIRREDAKWTKAIRDSGTKIE
jgi:tripartite-type tricarboxylate transporter receptor subunit TctC